MPNRKIAVKTVGNKKPLVKSAGGVGGGNKKKGTSSSPLKMPGAKTKLITRYSKSKK